MHNNPITNQTPQKTFSPETCPPISVGYCEIIDRYDPDPPAVLLTPYEWAAVLDTVQAAIDSSLLNPKASIWAQMIREKLQAAVFPAELCQVFDQLNRQRAGRN